MIGNLLAFLGSALFLGAQKGKENIRKIGNNAEARKVSSIPLNMSRQIDVSNLFYSYRKEEQEQLYLLVKNSNCDDEYKVNALKSIENAMRCVNYNRDKNIIKTLSDYMYNKEIDLCVWEIARDEGWVVDKFLAPDTPTGYTCAETYDSQKANNQF